MHVKTNPYRSLWVASDSGIERQHEAVFKSREPTLSNNRHDLCEYFEGFAFSLVLPLYLRALWTYPLYPILHHSYHKVRNEDLYL